MSDCRKIPHCDYRGSRPCVGDHCPQWDDDEDDNEWGVCVWCGDVTRDGESTCERCEYGLQSDARDEWTDGTGDAGAVPPRRRPGTQQVWEYLPWLEIILSRRRR